MIHDPLAPLTIECKNCQRRFKREFRLQRFCDECKGLGMPLRLRLWMFVISPPPAECAV